MLIFMVKVNMKGGFYHERGTNLGEEQSDNRGGCSLF